MKVTIPLTISVLVAFSVIASDDMADYAMEYGIDVNAQENRTTISDWQSEGTAPWSTKNIKGRTEYQVITEGELQVLAAKSDSSASGLVLSKNIDLKETPYLNWSWKVTEQPSGLDEQSKSGDDYPARIYLVKSNGMMMWNTISLNYVWSSSQTKGSTWDSAYVPEKVKMVAVRGNNDPLSTWFQEKRNAWQDMVNAFGDLGNEADNEDAYRHIIAVAIMTDTDDSKQSAEAFYGDIWFSAE